MAGPEVLVPVTLFTGGFAMVFGIVYLRTRQNLAMIEKGMNPKESVSRTSPFKSLKAGLLMLGAGLGLLSAVLIDIFLMPLKTDPVGIYFALISIGGGIGLLVSYMVEKKNWDKEKE